MATLGAPGTGFSSRDPSQAVDTVAGIVARRRSSGGGRSSSPRTPTPTVSYDASKGTILINGVGYSVRASDVANFIQSKTGGSGSYAQAAIAKAKVEQARQAAAKAEQERKAAVIKAEQDRRAEQIASQQTSSRDMTAQQFQDYLRRQSNIPDTANKYFQGYSYKKQQPKATPEYKDSQKFYLPSGEIVTPTYGLGAGGTQTTVGTYQPKESKQYIQSAEAAVVPSLTLSRTTYLPTVSDKNKYKKLLEDSKYNPIARFKLDQFLKNQEKKMELNIREANAVNKALEDKNKQAVIEEKKANKIINDSVIKIQEKINIGEISFEQGKSALNRITTSSTSKLTKIQSDINKLSSNKVFDKLKYAQVISGGRGSQIGTGWDITTAAAKLYKKEDKKVNIPLLGEVSGRSAELGLKFGTEAYKAERDVLAFQLGGSALGTVGISAPAITGGARSLRALKVASAISAPTVGLSFGGLVGAKEFSRSGDIGLSLSAGLGTSAGFMGGIYSKQIVETPGKMGSWIKSNIHAPIKPGLKGVGKKGGTVLGTKSKLAQKQLQKYKAKKLSMTEEQALNEFKMKYKLRSQQVKLIEDSMKGKVYISQTALNKDLSKWKTFLRKAGLTEIQVADRLGEVAIKYQANMLLNNYRSGMITEEQFVQESKKLSETLQKFRLKTQQITIQSQQPKIIQEQRYTLREAATLQTPRQKQLQKLLTLQSQGQLTNQQNQQLIRLQQNQQLITKQPLLQDSGMSMMLMTKQISKQRIKQKTKQASILDSLSDSLTKQISKSQTKQLTKQKSILKRPQINKQVSNNIVDSLIGGRGGSGYTPLRPIKPGFTLFDFPDRRKIKKSISKKKQSIKKKPKYIAKITGFEAALGLGPRYVKAGTKFTGFEAIRGVSSRKTTKKKVKKKSIKKKKDTWNLY